MLKGKIWHINWKFHVSGKKGGTAHTLKILDNQVTAVFYVKQEFAL